MSVNIICPNCESEYIEPEGLIDNIIYTCSICEYDFCFDDDEKFDIQDKKDQANIDKSETLNDRLYND